jgi:hypothetical protein
MTTRDMTRKGPRQLNSTESSSSEETGPLKLPRDVLELGRHLVRELGFDDQRDTLGRWMAHHLAELINKAENGATGTERVRARKNATETILKIWEHRASLPGNAYPLAPYSEGCRSTTAKRQSVPTFRTSCRDEMGAAQRSSFRSSVAPDHRSIVDETTPWRRAHSSGRRRHRSSQRGRTACIDSSPTMERTLRVDAERFRTDAKGQAGRNRQSEPCRSSSQLDRWHNDRLGRAAEGA